MELNEFRKKLEFLEESFPVNDLTYKDEPLWPLIQLIIVESNLQENPNTYENFQQDSTRSINRILKNKIWSIKVSLSIIKFIVRNLSLKFIYKETILSLSLVSSRSIKTKKGNFSKFTDSLQILFPNWNVVELLPLWQKTLPLYSDYLRINENLLVNKIKVRYKNGFINEASQFLNNLNLRMETIGLKKIHLSHFLKYLELFKKSCQSHKILLNLLKPKAIVIGWFSHPYSFALSYLGNQFNIPTIELQHGQQGDNNTSYVGWKKVPTEGYKLMPKFFAMWNMASKTRVDNWIQKTNFHQSIITGNPWLALNKDKVIGYNMGEKCEGFLRQLNDVKKHKKIVLISLQPLSSNFLDCFPKHLLELMKKEDCFWCIRLHPLMGKEFSTQQETLRALGINNFNIEEITSIPLYTLFNYVEINITLWSSIAFEALSFGVPTIIIHKNGYDAMRKSIENNTFFFADDYASLKEILKSLYSKGFFNSEDVILSDSNQFKDVFNKIIYK